MRRESVMVTRWDRAGTERGCRRFARPLLPRPTTEQRCPTEHESALRPPGRLPAPGPLAPLGLWGPLWVGTPSRSTGEGGCPVHRHGHRVDVAGRAKAYCSRRVQGELFKGTTAERVVLFVNTDAKPTFGSTFDPVTGTGTVFATAISEPCEASDLFSLDEDYVVEAFTIAPSSSGTLHLQRQR
jgi:hypothetical protein